MTEPTRTNMAGEGRAIPAGIPVALTSAHLAQLERHARETYPEECCGILVGSHGESICIVSLHPTENRSAERLRDRYEVDPREILRLDRAAERSGREIVGFYHSHPDHPPRPSATDAEQAWPGYIYLIASVPQTGPTITKAWSFDEGLRSFHERPIHIREEAPRPCRTAAPARR